jgi:hypothetical protein|tara:strand:- start:14426 stop:15781 length:1356 start_codon:yes stop_codon:yes gene_type:complete
MLVQSITRGRKILIPKNKERDKILLKEAELFVNAVNLYIREVFSWIKDSEFVVKKIDSHGAIILVGNNEYTGPSGGTFYPTTHRKDGTEFPNPRITDTSLKTLFEYVFERYECEQSHALWKANVIAHAGTRISTTYRRFTSNTRKIKLTDYIKSTVRPPQLRNITLAHKKILMKHKDGKLTMQLANRKSLEINDFEIPQKNYDIHKDSFGGNLSLNMKKNQKNHSYTIQYACEKRFHPPSGWVGMDINKDKNFWMTLAEDKEDGLSYIIPKPETISDIEKKKNEIDKSIGNKNRKAISSTIRSKLRKEKKLIENKYERAIREQVGYVIRFLQDSNLGLGLDGLSLKNNYSFGQEKINKILEHLCIANKIAYRNTLAAYTSRDCYSCETRKVKRVKDGLPYVCENPECNKFQVGEVTHINAARNIAKQAKNGFLGSAITGGSTSHSEDSTLL